MIYCDTSFLVSLYLDKDVNHPLAAKTAAKFTSGIPYTLLCELELTNALRRLAASGMITSGELAAILSQIERDARDGFLVRHPVNQAAQYKLALEISKRRMALFGRSLDILHVSAAKLANATAVASFDAKQRELAKAEGFALVPSKLRTH